LNVTHYQIPTFETIQRWKDAAADGFKFCPKFPHIISHDRQLVGCEALTAEFCNAVLGLEEHLGMTFLQLPPTFNPKQIKFLEIYLKSLPPNFPISVEFRHADWFNNANVWKDTCEMLTEMKVGTVITDVSGRRDVLHCTLTTQDFRVSLIVRIVIKTLVYIAADAVIIVILQTSFGIPLQQVSDAIYHMKITYRSIRSVDVTRDTRPRLVDSIL
jgi:uncharacterized protein YecE (DUF72 family)